MEKPFSITATCCVIALYSYLMGGIRRRRNEGEGRGVIVVLFEGFKVCTKYLRNLGSWPGQD